MVGFLRSPLLGRRRLTYCILTWQRAEREGELSGDSYKGTNPVQEGSTLMTSCNPNYLPKAPPPYTITLGSGVLT